MKVVLRARPFHLTTEPLTKPAPLTVRVKAMAAGTEVGEREVMARPERPILNIVPLPSLPPEEVVPYKEPSWAGASAATGLAPSLPLSMKLCSVRKPEPSGLILNTVPHTNPFVPPL